jgi:two-component system nitrogen regulation sensor histidine kinase NtrY
MKYILIACLDLISTPSIEQTTGITMAIRYSFWQYFNWKLILISVLISTGAVYLCRGWFNPQELKVLETITGTTDIKIYHDFNQDGFSESLVFNTTDSIRFTCRISSWSGGIIDQTNYSEMPSVWGLLFADITGDHFDEIFAFTENKDSVFLYVHDIIAKKPVINRLFLVRPAELFISDRSFVQFFPLGLADHRLYAHRVLLFALRANEALIPRAVYALNLEERRIICKFDTRAAITNAFLFDLNGDGIDEIIISSSAWGNVQSPVKYGDDKCWLFVLNQHLEPIFPPLSFSEYPSEFICEPVQIYSERFLLVAPDYDGDKNIPNLMYLVNAQGKIYLQAPNPFHQIGDYQVVINYKRNPSVIYGWQGSNNLIKLNQRLETVRQVSTPFNYLRPKFLKDLDADDNEELICGSEKYMAIFDNDLSLKAKFPATKGGAWISFRETGPAKPLEVGLHDDNNFYRLGLIKNYLHTFFPFLFIVMAGAVYLIQCASLKLTAMINIYYNFFKFSFQRSSAGILIINQLGRILQINNQVPRILNLSITPGKGENINDVFSKYPRMIEPIQKALTTGKMIQQSIYLQDKVFSTEIEMLVQPFRSPLSSRNIGLVKLETVDLPNTSEKLQTWSRAVQKMAHDIKTPLSTVSLNLKALQIRLKKITIVDKDQVEFSDDIKMMQTELDHIHTMTKNFLKFSNLDQPHFQAFDIRTCIVKTLEQYQPYPTIDLNINISVDDDVKPVWADPQQIEMVLHILVENALFAMKGKGLISISVNMAQFLEKSFLEYVEIEIADTGPGISEENIKKIFEPYFTTKKVGTGMGLAIARKIIEDHGCSIEVHSKPNFGAIFRFSLPVHREEGKHE